MRTVRPDAGASPLEIVFVSVVLVVFAGLLLRFPGSGRCAGKHSTAQAMIQDFSVALKAYEADFGEFPSDEPGYYITRGNPGSLADLMSRNGPKGVPYYQFSRDHFNKRGQWVTPLGTPFKYRRNAGRPTVAQDPATMMNVHTFDMWASGCNDAPACDPETSEPPGKATLKNW